MTFSRNGDHVVSLLGTAEADDQDRVVNRRGFADQAWRVDVPQPELRPDPVSGSRRVLPRPIEEIFHVGLGAGPGVGCVAMVEHGETGVFGDPIALEPVELAEAAGNGHPCEHQLRQRDQVPGGISAAAEPQPSAQIGHPRGGGFAIEPECVR